MCLLSSLPSDGCGPEGPPYHCHPPGYAIRRQSGIVWTTVPGRWGSTPGVPRPWGSVVYPISGRTVRTPGCRLRADGRPPLRWKTPSPKLGGKPSDCVGTPRDRGQRAEKMWGQYCGGWYDLAQGPHRVFCFWYDFVLFVFPHILLFVCLLLLSRDVIWFNFHF